MYFITRLQIQPSAGAWHHPSLRQACVSSVFQLFEELQKLLTGKAEDQSPSQAQGLRRWAGSWAQGEALWEGHVAQLSGASISWLFCLLSVLSEKWGAGRRA